MSAPKADIPEILKILADARIDYEEADRVETQWRSTRLVALNRLNEAQRALDAAIGSLRKDAPTGTDWSRRSAERKVDTLPPIPSGKYEHPA